VCGAVNVPPDDDGWPELLGQQFEDFAADEGERIPMYAQICAGAAHDAEVLELLLAAPIGQRRPVLFLAALHDLVLSDPTVEVAPWFTTVTAQQAPSEDAWPAARRTVLAHAEYLREVFATRSTQTNEPNRSALWSIAVPWVAAEVERPVALVELGCSAALNLRWDHYGLELDGELVRRPDARTIVQTVVRHGVAPIASLPDVAARIGIDLSPIDLHDEREARWLRACVWPEQMHRFARFDDAVADLLADRDPPRLVAGDALEQVVAAIEGLPTDLHVVVTWSWFLTYLHGPRRGALDALLDAVGRDRPLTLISAEASGTHRSFVDPGLDGDDPAEFRTIVGISRWRDGHRSDEVVARCHAHLTWLDWLAS